MPSDILAFYETQAANGLTLCAAVADPLFTVSGDNIRLRGIPNTIIRRVQARNAHVVKAKIAVGEEVIPINIHGGGLQTITGALDPKTNLEINKPVRGNTVLNGYIDNANNNEVNAILVELLYGAPKSFPRVVDHWILGTGAATLGAGAWTSTPLSYDSGLDGSGRYAIRCMAAWSAGAVAARLVLPDSQFRPGVFAGATALAAYRQWLDDEYVFSGLTPPNAEFLSTSADTAEYVLLGIVRV